MTWPLLPIRGLIALAALLFYVGSLFASDPRVENLDEFVAFNNAEPSEKTDALNKLLHITSENFPEQAIALAQRESALIASAPADQRYKIKSSVCWAHISLSNFDTAQSLCQQVLAVAKTAGNKDRQASALNMLAIIAGDQGDDAKALQLYEQSLVLASKPMNRAAAHNNIGATLKDRGVYEEAFKHFDLALQAVQEPGVSEQDSCYQLTPAAFGISDINQRLGDLPSAVRHIEMVVSCAQTTSNLQDHVAALAKMTSLLLVLGDEEGAENRSRQAQRLAQSRDGAVASMAYRARAEVLNQQGDFKGALSMASQAYDFALDLPFGVTRVNTTLLFAELLARDDQHTDAISLLTGLANEARALSRTEILEQILSALPALYESTEQLKKALAVQKEASQLSRSNLQQSTLRRMTLLQSRLGSEQQALAAKNAQVLQLAAEEEAGRATFTRNTVVIVGLLLLLVGYLINSRRLQTQQASLHKQAKKSLESELHAQSEKLNKQAAENLALETQILHTQKLEAVGKLTGGVAHDFNNLMVVVMGAIELVRKSDHSKLSDNDRQLLADANEAVTTGTEITQQLLAYSRQQPLDPTPTEISTLLDSTSSMLNHALGNRLSLSRVMADEPIWCEIDRAQLVTALINLIINARDATEGAGKVQLSCFRESVGKGHPKLAAGDYCTLAVQDFGSGIDPAELDQVIEPFYTTKESGSGHGLGLSMVYGFVKQSKGELEIDSELGKGTAVTIWLPLCPPPLAQEQPITQQQAFEFDGAKKTVLVVEDQPQVLAVAEKILINLDYAVHTAHTGTEAKQLIQDGLTPDIVFSDVSMPGDIDGIQLARWLDQNRPGTSVLLSSGYPSEQIAELNAQFLAKPYRSHQLASAMERALDQSTER
ncbi:MAG: ATP-binding protein [Lysobacterales bacterium]